MNREIKFRAWDDIYKTFNSTVAANLLMQLHEDSEDLDSEYGKRYFLSQFTGLHDKNGKEIYEGDIVDVDCSEIGGCFNDGVYKVEYAMPDCAFCLVQLDDSSAINFNECYLFTVTGNIYQHKNLLT